MAISRSIVLSFPPEVSTRPVTYHLVKDYNLVFNILKANVSSDKEGILVIEITGEQKDYDAGIEFLKDQGITVQPLGQDIIRREELCVNCGVCVGICPTGALLVKDRSSMVVEFEEENCIACEACVRICPYHAMEVHY